MTSIMKGYEYLSKRLNDEMLTYLPTCMAIRVVRFSNGGYRIRKDVCLRINMPKPIFQKISPLHVYFVL